MGWTLRARGEGNLLVAAVVDAGVEGWSRAAKDLHPLLRSRWSPMAWDAGHRLDRGEVEAIVEAARWAPSAGNSQPWSFLIGCRGDDTHQRLVAHLAGSAAAWAPSASLIVANLCHRYVEGTDWDYSEFALYDLGQAVAHMTIQARALGLQARQFRAFDRAGVSGEFSLPGHWEVTSMTAFGLPADGDAAPRDRRPLTHLDWNQRPDIAGG